MLEKHFWIETVGLVTVITCALALAIATLGAAAEAVVGYPEAGQASEPTPAQHKTYEGMVTCTSCGAKHSAKLGQTATECTRSCVAHSGAAFALIDGDRTYRLDGDLILLRKAAGRRVRVTGVLNGSTIKVSSVIAES